MSQSSENTGNSGNLSDFGFKPIRNLNRTPPRERSSSLSKRKATSPVDSPPLHAECCNTSKELQEIKLILLENTKSVNNLIQQVDEFKLQTAKLNEDINNLKTENMNLRAANADLTNTVKQLKAKQSEVTNKLEELENRQRRDNLVFYNVPAENVSESWETTKAKINEVFIKANLKHVKVDRAHRIGKSTTTPRPIIAKIPSYDDRNSILRSWKPLKELGISVSQDFSAEMRKKRSFLNSICKKAKQEGKNAKIRFDRLIVNGEVFICDESISDVIKIDSAPENVVNSSEGKSNNSL